MLGTTLRIVEADEAASLHPRAIWNHWKRDMVWDPRTYYGVLEFGAVFISLTAVSEFQPNVVLGPSPGSTRDTWYTVQKLFSGILLGLAIPPLHWYSNHRQTAHVLTRVRTHFHVLLLLAVTLSVSQIYSVRDPPTCGRDRCYSLNVLNAVIWLSIPFLLLTASIVYIVGRNPRRDPIWAELPSPTAAGIDFKDDGRATWANVNVADGIEDDSPDLEGQLRL